MPHYFTVAVSDEITPLTIGSKITFPIETDFVITNIRAFLTTPQISGTPLTIDILDGGASILSTKITMDNGAQSNIAAAIPAVVSIASLPDYSPITIQVMQIGDGTAKGLKVTFYGYRPLNASVSVTPPSSPAETLVDRTAGTNIGNMTVFGLANAFDGATNSAGAACAAISGGPGYIGKTFSTAKKFSRAVVYGANDRGFIDTVNPSMTITVYGKNGIPTGPTDGTVLGSLTFTDTANESSGRTISSINTVTGFTSWWAYINGSANSTYCAELVLYELV